MAIVGAVVLERSKLEVGNERTEAKGHSIIRQREISCRDSGPRDRPVTFTDLTHGTVTGAGISATNFTLPDDSHSFSFSPFVSYLQFGTFKNDGANDGHNNQSSGTFSRIQFTGGAYPIDDIFNGAGLTNNYNWRVTNPNAVTYVPPGTAWWINWTLPADGFTVESAPTVVGPWANASVTNVYQSGATMSGAVPVEALPGPNAFFRLSRPSQ